MNKKRTSIDGFVLKSSSQRLDGFDAKSISQKLKSGKFTGLEKPTLKHKLKSSDRFASSQNNIGPDLKSSDIQESLDHIEEDSPLSERFSFRQRRKVKKEAKKAKRQKKIKRRLAFRVIFLAIGLLLVGFLGYNGYRFLLASGNIFGGNVFQLFQGAPLKQDSLGRSNFLILGTSEDDPGHEGPNLTDSMIIVSINQEDKDAYIFSIPRDLYVKYDRACITGYSGKVNAYFYCVDDGEDAEAEQKRLSATKDFIGDILAMELHYAVRINYTVVKEAVDAVGGIDVDVQGSGGAPGILDRHFDYLCDYKCYMVKYDNGIHHLDGQQALNLARVRGESEPTYGLARSNFDREINQQKILVALKDKAVSSGVITDINKIMELVDSLGNNLRTNIQAKELRTIINIAKDMGNDKVYRLDLVDYNGSSSVLTSINDDLAGSIVIPKSGYFNYEELRAFLAKNITSDPIKKESAPIVILNGSGQSGLAKIKADDLTNLGFNIKYFDNAPAGDYQSVEIYQIGEGNEATAQKLSEIYKMEMNLDQPPVQVSEDVRFVIIFGSDIASD